MIGRYGFCCTMMSHFHFCTFFLFVLVLDLSLSKYYSISWSFIIVYTSKILNLFFWGLKFGQSVWNGSRKQVVFNVTQAVLVTNAFRFGIKYIAAGTLNVFIKTIEWKISTRTVALTDLTLYHFSVKSTKTLSQTAHRRYVFSHICLATVQYERMETNKLLTNINIST